MAGEVMPGPPPPVKVVWEKLPLRRMFLFKYQFIPTDQAWAAEADVEGLEKPLKAPLSMSSSA